MDEPIETRSLALPLRRGEVLRTSDVDEVREEVARIVAPHQLTPVRRGPLDAIQTATTLGGLTLFQIGYGADIRIDAEGCGPNYLVKVPIAGTTRMITHGEDVDASVTMGGVLNPDLDVTLDYAADCTQLIMCIPQGRLERQCAQLLGVAELRKPLHFDLGLRLDDEAGQRWLRLMAYARQEASRGAGAGGAGPVALLTAPLEAMVMNTLLASQRHSYLDSLLRPQSSAAPRHVTRAEAFMEAHAADPLTPGEIAQAVGVSERALYRGFQDFRGLSPMARLKELRLERVHKALLAAEPSSASVTEVALQWGFGHLGHFGEAYRRRFDETPSETLRR
jgi:AraC-like DNA-binding protein